MKVKCTFFDFQIKSLECKCFDVFEVMKTIKAHLKLIYSIVYLLTNQIHQAIVRI